MHRVRARVFLILVVSCGWLSAADFAYASLDQSRLTSAVIQDIPYQFDSVRVGAAKNSFQFFRSFAEYDLILMARNSSALTIVSQLSDVDGWCAGDPHVENFGVMIREDDSRFFGINDVDDSGPCPVALDLLRFLTSAKLAAQSFSNPISIDWVDLVQSYATGVEDGGGGTISSSRPLEVDDLEQLSLQRGRRADPKWVRKDRLIRSAETTELTPDEWSRLLQNLSGVTAGLGSAALVIDAVATTKIGGGSSGLRRIEVLVLIGSTRLQIQLKEIGRPATEAVSRQGPIGTDLRLTRALELEQENLASQIYQVVLHDGVEFLVRPRFYGNVDVKFNALSATEAQELMSYEAWVLGRLHGRTVQSWTDWSRRVRSIPELDWSHDIGKLSNHHEDTWARLSPP